MSYSGYQNYLQREQICQLNRKLGERHDQVRALCRTLTDLTNRLKYRDPSVPFDYQKEVAPFMNPLNDPRPVDWLDEEYERNKLVEL